MLGKPRLAVFVAAVLVAIAFLATVPTARASMDRPSWAAGDYWTYGFKTSLYTTSENGTLTLKVLGTDTVTINGTAYPTYKVNASVVLPFGGATVTYYADVWFSSDTLALVRATFTYTFVSTESIAIQGSPPQAIQWPLTAGASWQSATTVWTSVTNSTGTYWSHTALSTDFTVLADATITVPAGTFATSPLKEADATNGTYTVNYWSAQVGNWARVESYSNTGQDQGGFNLTSYNYQGGSFLTAVILGLQGWVWLTILAVVIIAVVAVVLVRRRARPPAAAPAQQPPPGPPGTP